MHVTCVLLSLGITATNRLCFADAGQHLEGQLPYWPRSDLPAAMAGVFVIAIGSEQTCDHLLKGSWQ